MKKLILILLTFFVANINAQVAKSRYIKVDEGKNKQVYEAIKEKLKNSINQLKNLRITHFTLRQEIVQDNYSELELNKIWQGLMLKEIQKSIKCGTKR